MGSQGRSRHNRHLRLAEKVTGAHREEFIEKFKARVLLTGDADLLQSADGRLAALTAVNLITRFCDKFDIDFGSNEALQQEALDLASRIDRDPVVDYGAVSGGAVWEEYEAVLYIGWRARIAPNVTRIAGRGWLAAVSSFGSLPFLPLAPYNPFGAILAASFGAGEVFKRLLHAHPEKVPFFEPTVFSAYSYKVWGPDDMLDQGPMLPSEINFPPTFLAGAGAIGNAFAYALREVPGVRGPLVVVDKEDVSDDTNLNRYCLAFHDDAYGTVPVRKVDLVDRAFAGTGVQRAPYKEKIESYLGRVFRRDERRPSAIISAVDNNYIRPSLQRLWPNILLEGATSDSLFQVSRHAHAEALACLMCIHTVNQSGHMGRPYEETVAERTGLSVATVRAALQDVKRIVTEEDVVVAPQDKRAFLRDRVGKPICSVLTEMANLSETPEDVPAAATVSFVSMASGALVAAELVKWAVGFPSALQTLYQMDMFVPLANAMLLPVEKMKACECSTRRDTIEHYRAMVGST